MTHTGRIYAVTTRGYTGVTMFSGQQDAATNTVLVVMSRARKRATASSSRPFPAHATLWRSDRVEREPDGQKSAGAHPGRGVSRPLAVRIGEKRVS